MTLDDLIVSIKIEEKHRSRHKPPPLSSNLEMQGNANLVTAKKGKQFRNKKFKKQFKPTGRVQKDQKQKTCYVCGKAVHFTKQCKFQKSKGNGESSHKNTLFQQANMITGTS